MIRSVLFIIYFVLYLFYSLIYLAHYHLLGWLNKKEQQEAYLYQTTSKWAKRMLWAGGGKVEVIGLENIPIDKNFLIVANHQSYYDIPLMMGMIPETIGFIAKVETSKIPVISTWMNLLHCIFLDRKDTRQSLKAILTGIEYLKKGHSLVIFPEGTRSKGGPMGDFKSGSMKLATKSNALVVPITIDGSYKLLEEKKRFTAANVKLYIHRPVDIETLTKDEKNNLAFVIKKKIESKLK